MNLGIKIDKPSKGRRIVVGDIHGCFNTFESLIEDKLLLSKEDQLFLLGDYIDRGPRNREVLDFILELQRDEYQIYPLMGNHEYFLLRDLEFCKISKNKVQIRDIVQSADLLNMDYEIDEKYIQFIQSLPFYYELDNFILVHAGLDFSNDNPLKDKMSMIYARNFEVNRKLINNKILIHGHTPVSINEIQSQMEQRAEKGKINLDNGCVYKHYNLKADKGLGNLCALILDTFELIYSENID